MTRAGCEHTFQLSRSDTVVVVRYQQKLQSGQPWEEWLVAHGKGSRVRGATKNANSVVGPDRCLRSGPEVFHHSEAADRFRNPVPTDAREPKAIEPDDGLVPRWHGGTIIAGCARR